MTHLLSLFFTDKKNNKYKLTVQSEYKDKPAF